MDRDSQALLLLVAVLVLALAGIATYVSGAARRAELASRGGPGDEEGALRRLLGALDVRLRKTGARPPAGARGCRAPRSRSGRPSSCSAASSGRSCSTSSARCSCRAGWR